MSKRLFEALARRAAETPTATALIGEGDGGDFSETWSAAALLAEVEQLAARLAAQHAQAAPAPHSPHLPHLPHLPHSPLALLADNGPDWAIADLAALRAEIPLLPLPPFFSPAQLAHVLDACASTTVLTDQPARILALDPGFAPVDRWRSLTRLQRRPAGSIGATPLPAGTAKLSFTSGSTGTPKGVCLSAAGLVDTAVAVAERLADLPVERHLAVLPLSLLLENSAGLYAPLLRGAEVCLPKLETLGWRGMAGFDPGALQQVATRLQPGTAILVPELLKAWSLYLAASRQRAPAALVFVAVGGARVDAAAVARARALGLPAYQGYGLTECGSVVSLNRPGDDGNAENSAGRPLAHAAVRIVDGEVQVTTRAFLGYLGDEAAIPGAPRVPFSTGDLGELRANGHLTLTGRRKNLLITAYGRNVSPEWVEAALLAQPAILQAVVAGEAAASLSAILVPSDGAGTAAIDAAVATANAGLPDYARIGRWLPAAAPFTPQNGLATGNGRPRRAAILEHYAAALAGSDTSAKETADELP